MVSAQQQMMQAAGELPNLNFGLNVKQLSCLIHPVIVSNILDHFLRRPKGQRTVVGTLAGTLDGQSVDVQSSFSVPLDIEPDNSIILDKDYLQKMLKFYRKVNPKEGLLGLYLTGTDIDKHAIGLYKYYHDLCRDKKNKSPLAGNPLLILIDPTMEGNKLTIKVLTLVTSNYVPVFAECQFSFALQDYERSGLDVLFFGQNHYDTMAILQQRRDIAQEDIGRLNEEQQLLSNKDLLLKNFTEVIDNLTDCDEYIQSVIDGKQVGDCDLGRLLNECLSEFSTDDMSLLEQLIAGNFEDALMMSSLSKLQKHQLNLSERLNTAFSKTALTGQHPTIATSTPSSTKYNQAQPASESK